MPLNRSFLVRPVAAAAASALALALAASPAPAQERIDTRLAPDGYEYTTEDDMLTDERSGLRYGLDAEEDFAAGDFGVGLNDGYDPIGFNEDRHFGANDWTTDDPTWNEWYDTGYDAGYGTGTVDADDDGSPLDEPEFGLDDDDDAGLDHNFGVDD